MQFSRQHFSKGVLFCWPVFRNLPATQKFLAQKIFLVDLKNVEKNFKKIGETALALRKFLEHVNEFRGSAVRVLSGFESLFENLILKT